MNIIKLYFFLVILNSLIPALCSPCFAESVTKVPVVGHIKITGNRTISDTELKRLFKIEETQWYHPVLRLGKGTLFDSATLQDDITRVKDYYQSIGYDSVQVVLEHLDRLNGTVDITIRIDEGLPLIVDRIELRGLKGTENVKERDIFSLLLLRPNERFQRRFLDNDQSAILNFLRSSGYAYAEVEVTIDPNSENRRVTVIYTVTHGPVCRFGRPIVQNARSAISTVFHEIAFRPGETYSIKKLGTTQMQIYHLGIFQFVSVDPILSKTDRKDTVDVRITVYGRLRRFLKVGAGWSTEDRYRGSLLLEHRDFLGGARRLSLTARASAVSEVDLRFKQPYLFDNKTDIIASWFARDEKQPKYTFRAFGGSTRLSREFSPSFSGSLEYRYEFVKSSLDTSSTETPIVIRSGFENIPRLRLKAIRNTSDDLFDPTSGSSATLTAERTGVLFPSNIAFYKLTFESRWYRKTSRRTVVAFRGFIGLLNPVGSKRQIPTFDLFYAGGANSLRGWKRQRLTDFGGEGTLQGNVELRFPLWYDVAGAAFLDYGNVWRKPRAIDITDLQYSIGGGIRYRTVVGPIRLDFGYQLHEKKPFRQRYAIHFNLGQAF